MYLAIWDFPVFYSCISNIENIKKFVLDKLFLKHFEFKAVLNIFLSIVCFYGKTPCIAAGILLDLTAVLLIFAAINRQIDIIDEQSYSNRNHGIELQPRASLLGATKTFGTFQV
jgi:hypothetical protein